VAGAAHRPLSAAFASQLVVALGLGAVGEHVAGRERDGLLAAFQTRGWRIPAWCAGTAAMVFGLASMVFPTYRGAAGRGWEDWLSEVAS
jgi:hypothetical protein